MSYFKKIFDCLNVRSKSEWIGKRNPNLKPYTSPADERLKVYNYIIHMNVLVIVYGLCIVVGE